MMALHFFVFIAIILATTSKSNAKDYCKAHILTMNQQILLTLEEPCKASKKLNTIELSG